MKITDASLKHSVSVYVLIGVLVLGGMISYANLPREAAPEIDFPLILVSTVYLGVSPADMESLVTQPLERELAEITEIKDLRSTSAESASIIQVEFGTDTNLDEALQKVRDKVGLAKPKLPTDAEEPVIKEISTTDFPMMIVNVTAEYDLLTLMHLAEDVQDDIENVRGVLEVKMAGDVEREIQVRVDPSRLNHFGISLQDVVNAVGSENVNMPGGDIKVGGASFLVRVPGEFEDPMGLEDIVVKLRGDHAVYLRDVASVHDSFKEQGTYSRLDQRPNISLTVTKRPGENIIHIADTIKEIVAKWQADAPPGTEFAILGDASEDIRGMVKELENSMATGLILVVGVILLVMGMRNALLVGVAIPLSMLITFVILAMTGTTLNMIVLFALILALGMLVDNAIVIVENIYRHASEGKTVRQAAEEGTREVAWPVATSTLTTVAAFAPLAFWPGVVGEFMSYMPKTVIVVLLASLFVALVINPVLAAAFMKIKAGTSVPGQSTAGQPQWMVRFLARYERILRSALEHRYRTLAGIFAMLIASFVAFGAAGLGVEFFPTTTPRKIFIDVDTGDGSNLRTSDQVVGQIESVLAKAPNIEHFVANVGGGTGDGAAFGGGESVAHKSRVSIDFVAAEEQEESVWTTIEGIRRGISTIPGARLEIVKEQTGPPTGAPVTIELYGDDIHVLGREAQTIRQRIENVPGLVDLKDDYAVGRPEIRIEPDRERAKILNAGTTAIAQTVRTAVNGTKASVLRDGEDEYDITVRLDERYRGSLDDLESLRINVASRNNPDVTYLIPIREVADIKPGGGTGAIRHKDRERVVTVTANVEGRLDKEALTEVQGILADHELPPGYRLSYAGQEQDSAEAQAFLGNAFLMALFIIALILVTQFNSITLPAIIMLAVLLSLVGVLWGQIVTQLPFGIIMTGLGVISLAGVVVNNGIVLVDYVQQLRDSGMSRREALVQAGLVRLRPVLLTAVTTVLGLVPMALRVSIDFSTLSIQVGGQSADFWQSMAVAIISGLTVATALTLLIVPTLYATFDDIEEKVSSWLRQRKPRADSVDVGSS